MTRINAGIRVDVDVKAVAELLRRAPDEVAAAANAVSFDMHNGSRGFIRRRIISRGASKFSSRTKGRRFIAAALDRSGGAYHRKPGRIKLSRIDGETFSLSEELGAFTGQGVEDAVEPMIVPLDQAKKGRLKRVFREELIPAARSGDLQSKGFTFIRVGGKLMIARKRKRRGRQGQTHDFLATVRRRVRRPLLVDINQILSDLPEKMRGNFVREVRRRLKRLEQGESPPAGATP